MKRNYITALLILLSALASAGAGEGRIEISQADVATGTYTVNVSGSYIFTEDIFFTNANRSCIRVDADNVTIDLNGFGLYSSNTNSEYGIQLVSNPIPPGEYHSGFRVFNGTLANWGDEDSGAAIDASGRNSHLSGLNVYGSYYGIVADKGGIISGCSARSNEVGIYTSYGSVVRDCVADHNTRYGIGVAGGVIIRCTAVSNGLVGIVGSEGTAISDCTASGNSSNGIFVVNGSIVSGCIANNNAHGGLVASVSCLVSGCAVAGNGRDGIAVDGASTVLRCTAQGNNDCGVIVGHGGMVSDCTLLGNGEDGISLDDGYCRVTGNLSATNGMSGIWSQTSGRGSHIQNNSAIRNDRAGIEITSAPTNNMVIKNSAGGNPWGNYAISGMNSVGPVTSDESNTYECANFDL